MGSDRSRRRTGSGAAGFGGSPRPLFGGRRRAGDVAGTDARAGATAREGPLPPLTKPIWRASARPRPGEIAVVAAWVVACIIVVAVLGRSAGRLVTAQAVMWLFVIATGIMVVAFVAFGRLSNRTIREGLHRTDVALHSMELLTDPTLSFLPLDELLEELLTRTRDVLRGDIATVFLLTADGRYLSVRASRGLDQWLVLGAQVPVGQGIIGSVASKAEAVIVHDVAAEPSAMPIMRSRVASLMAAPLLVTGRVIGVVQVGTSDLHRFEPGDLRLLQLVADRAAASIERARLDETGRRSRLGAEQARRHLDLLARASDVLATALESYEETFLRLVEVLVPSFADWMAIDLVDEKGRIVRVASGSRGEPPQGVGDPDTELHRHRHPEGDRLVRRALATGRPELALNAERLGGLHPGALAGPGEFSDAAPAAGVESMMVVPVHVRGLAFGALSLVTGSGRRGYRRSDLDTAMGLAERAAVAVERVLLWRETRAAELVATRNAAQLRRLVEAALAVNAPLEGPEVLRVLAARACQVLDADYAVVTALAPFHANTQATAQENAQRSTPATGPPSVQVAHPSPDPALAGIGEDDVAQACRSVAGADGPLRFAPARDVEGPSWMGAPLPGVDSAIAPSTISVPGVATRALVVMRASGAEFGAEAESMFALLAQMATVALENARLYQAVQGNEERLRAVLDSSPIAIAELDVRGGVRWWNRASALLFGWPPPTAAPGPGARATGRARRIPATGSSGQEIDTLWDEARAGSARTGLDLTATDADGRVIDLSVSAAPLRDHAGVVRGVLVVMEDVTDRRRMLEQINQTERLGAMARLAGGVAHDFNNLLTVILGSSEILLRRLDEDEAREEVAAIQRAGERAAALTNQLLAVGQRSSVQPELTDPDAVLAGMTPMIARALGDRVHVELRPAEEPKLILVDPAEFERVVLNLALNSHDAMPDGGRFLVSTSAEPTSGDVRISIADDGMGMDADTVAHCFEPFFTTKGRAQGTGLGLAAVHASVTQAGGRVLLESKPGKGSTFTLVFPAVKVEAIAATAVSEGVRVSGDEVGRLGSGHGAEGTPSPARPIPTTRSMPAARSAPSSDNGTRDGASQGASGSRTDGAKPDEHHKRVPGEKTVLLVEDEGELRRLAVRALASRGYHVVAASDAEEALTLARALRRRPDLLVTDVVMPGISGVGLAERLRKRWRTLPVLFVSGHLEEQDLGVDPLGGGPADLLAKPFTPQQLGRRVRLALERAEARALSVRRAAASRRGR